MFVLAVLCESFFDRACKLVSAGSSTGTTGVAAEDLCDFIGFLTFAELGDSLEIAVASAGEYEIGDDAVFDIEGDVGGAGAGGLVAVFHFCFSFHFECLKSLGSGFFGR